MNVALLNRDTMLTGHGRRLPPGWPTEYGHGRAGTPIFGYPSGLDQLDRDGGRVAAADAQTGYSAPLAAALQCMDQRRQDSHAGGPDRMAQRTGSAVDVHAGVIQIQVPDGDHRDHGERLVHLVE